MDKDIKIAVDMDDVLAATYSQVIRIFREENENDYTDEWFEGKSYKEAFPGHHLEIAISIPHRKDFFDHLPVMENSPEVMKALCDKYDVFIVSAAMEYPYSLKPKLDWLKIHFPFIHWKNIVMCGDKSIIKADYLIDDHSYNLETFNGQPLIYSALHNLKETRFERMNNWEDIASKFL
ncbi:MAG: 5'(3')-deoxyribonucleotidase [Cyclobacteriaceae bacterium]